MKKIFALLLLSLTAVWSLSAQKTEVYRDGMLLTKSHAADSIVFSDARQMSREEIRDWTYDHLDSLVEVAWTKLQTSSTPNKRDPDETREVFRSIGYDGRNPYHYLLGGAVLDSVIFDRLIEASIQAGNTHAVLISGNSGAGKGYSIRNNPDVQAVVDNAGVVLDETFNSMKNVQRAVERLRQHGFTDIDQVLVYRDALSSFSSAAERFVSTGRVIGLKFFIFIYQCYQGYVDILEQENLTDRRYYIENMGTPHLVTADEARQWDYTIDLTKKRQLASYLYDFIIANHDKMSNRDVWALILDETKDLGAAKPATVRDLPLVIMHDNDVHCAVDGYVEFAGLRDAIVMADSAYVATVSSGDFLQGGAMGGFSKGEYIVQLMNAVDYDAVTLGNHEFDYGIDRQLEMTSLLKAPVTCVNFYNTASQQCIYAPYIMKQMGPKKVAFVGAVTPETMMAEKYAFVDEEGNPRPYDLMESKAVELIQEAVDEARGAGADYVILLSHLGEYDRGSEVYSIPVIQQTTGITAVLDGHTHSLVPEQWYLNAQGDSVLLTQTGTKFSHFGKLVINPDGSLYSQCITNDDLNLYANPLVSHVLDSINVLVGATMNVKVVHSDYDLTATDAEGNHNIRTEETNLGDFVTDAIRFASGAQIAFINSGGLRSNISAGDITYGNCYDAIPYSDNVSILEVNAEHLRALLENSVAKYPTPKGSFLQMSGIRFSFDAAAEVGARVQSIEVEQADGSFVPIDKALTYQAAMTNYISEFDAVKECRHIADDVVGDIESIIKYSESLGGEIPAIYATAQGRIIKL